MEESNKNTVFSKLDRNNEELVELKKEYKNSKLMNWITFGMTILSLLLAIISLVF